MVVNFGEGMKDNLRVMWGGTPQNTVDRVRGKFKFQLTPDGMIKAEEMEGSGAEVALGAAMLEKKYPMSLKEIAQQSHLGMDVTYKILMDWSEKRLVQRMTQRG